MGLGIALFVFEAVLTKGSAALKQWHIDLEQRRLPRLGIETWVDVVAIADHWVPPLVIGLARKFEVPRSGVNTK
jgi:hypothetical protein